MIYLDHASTTPMLPEVWEAMQPFAQENFGNPSSAHAVGRRARKALEDARDQIASILGAYPNEVIFTSGATESNNLALFGLAGTEPKTILASPFEHPCVVEPLQVLARRGHRVIHELGDSEPDLTVAMLVNHETGALVAPTFPRPPNSLFHCDAAQAIGKKYISFHELGYTTLSGSAHKFGGPRGIGLLLVRSGVSLEPMLHGGHQQQGRRPGTEPVMLAVGMATALDIAFHNMAGALMIMSRGSELMVRVLREQCPPIVVNSQNPSLPYILNISFPGCRADLLLMKLDLAGIACSTGSACSSGSLLPSPVLAAMGVPDDVLRSAMRFSFGARTKLSEIEEAAGVIAQCVNKVRAAE